MTIRKTFQTYVPWFFGKRSISSELTAFLLLLMIIVQALTFGVFYHKHTRFLQAFLEEKADSYVTNFTEVLSTPVWAVDYEQVERIGKIFIQNDLIQEIQVFDSKNNLLFESQKKTPAARRIKRHGDIIYGQRVVGRAELSISISELKNREMALFHKTNFYISVVSLVVILAATSLLMRIFMQAPLNKLKQGIDRVAEGDYSYGFDEIRHIEIRGIAKRIKDMAVLIRAREESLRLVNKDLGNEVRVRTEVERKLSESNTLLKAVIEQAPYGISVCECRGNDFQLSLINEELSRLTGISKKAVGKIGLRDGEFFGREHVTWKMLHQEDQSPWDLEHWPMAKVTKGHEIIENLELVYWHGNSDKLDVLFNGKPVYDSQGNMLAGIGMYKDITESKKNREQILRFNRDLEKKVIERTEALESVVEQLRRNEIALRESRERYKATIESIEDGYMEVDMKGRLLFVNEAVSRMAGYTRDDLFLMPPEKFLDEKNREKVFQSFSDVYTSGIPKTEFDFEIIRKDGSLGQMETSISVIKSPAGKSIGFRGIVRDIEQRKKQEEKLIYLAYHDALTGLHNRKAFYEHLKSTLIHAGRYGTQVTLLYMDIDEFKTVNDTLGHEAGDLLLQEISRRLKACLRKTDFLSRIGGDEFTLVVDNPQGVNLDAFAGKIVETTSAPYTIKGTTVNYISSSIGISIFPRDAGDVDSLIEKADAAMYRAKNSKKR